MLVDGSAEALELAGQVMLGGVTSLTVNVVVQVSVLPAASVAVTVTTCGPGPTGVPANGLCVLVTAPGHESEAVAAEA